MSGVWFRKGLRLHDNPALCAACEAGAVVPFYVLDPADTKQVGPNRLRFLLESLQDLDAQLKGHGSRLLVLRGATLDVLRSVVTGKGPFKVSKLFWEEDTDANVVARDASVRDLAKGAGVAVQTFHGHTLLDLDAVRARPGFKPPTAMAGIVNLVESVLATSKDALTPKPVPKIPKLAVKVSGLAVPAVSELCKGAEKVSAAEWPGGEREALKRLVASLADKEYVATFRKPQTASTGRPQKPWEPSTTGLSPYLALGCLSVKRVYHAVQAAIAGRKNASQPPESLIGQIMFREMFHIIAVTVPQFGSAEGNRMCIPVAWGHDQAKLTAWAEGRTGFPYIDALMRQLKTTGHMHHLGRHAVACFLTRGDLWQHWTAGRDVFKRLLLDEDWALNNGNWLWLAGVAPFSMPYFRIYDPCPGPKSCLNAEQSGEFIKHFVPELKNLPEKYIYAPWTAPAEVLKKAGVTLGKEYPKPIVDHSAARKENLDKFAASLAKNRANKEKEPKAPPAPRAKATPASASAPVAKVTKAKPAKDGPKKGEPTFCDVAKLGTSSCKITKSPIPKGAVRLGYMMKTMYGEQKCYVLPAAYGPVPKPAALEGYASLTAEQKRELSGGAAGQKRPASGSAAPAKRAKA